MRRGAASLRDLRLLVEIAALVIVTWLVLGWYFTYAITQADGTLFLAPYTQSQLAAGVDWTTHLYRIGVMGGSPMHEYAGTLPLIQVCNVLGLSTTSTLNVQTIFLQMCFGFFGVKAMLALARIWYGADVGVSTPERLACVWICAFAPWLGWRLGLGHESIPEGLLPLLVALALLWSARASQLSVAALAFGWFAVFNGVSGFGAQLILYSLVFGGPLAAVVLLDRRGWNRDLAIVCAALASAVLVAVPRVAGMLAYASSGDAGRTIGDSVAYTFGEARWTDWLASVPWTVRSASGALPQDTNYPIGPLLCVAVLLWPRGAQRRLAWAMLGGALLAVLFAANVRPVSTALFALVPPLESFRIPARAILPVLMLLPSVALAALWVAREPARADEADAPRARLLAWLGLAVGCALIAAHGVLPPLLCEPLAWTIALALVVLLRLRPRLVQHRALIGLLAPLAALGVLAFSGRVPHHLPHDPIESGPSALRHAVLAEAPELAMPLNRVILVDAPRPYRMALAFAAGLSSIDGDFNPPRRFIELLNALSGHEIPSSSVVFDLGRSPMFPTLQQLYNIRYAITFAHGGAMLSELPTTPGPAWLPRRIETRDDIQAIGAALRQDVGETAYVLRRDRVDVPSTCNGHVLDVATDPVGQRASVRVETTTACTLVLATNYVHALHASAAGHSVRVFPVNIALTGIAIPPGRTTVTLFPLARMPWWSRAASIVGWLLLATAFAGACRPTPRE